MTKEPFKSDDLRMVSKLFPGSGVDALMLNAARELDRLAARITDLEREKAGLREHLRRIVETAKFADFSATSERVFSDLDVFLDEARKALEAP
jgi:hypothetical protein